MKTSTIAEKYKINAKQFEDYLRQNDLHYTMGIFGDCNVEEKYVEEYVNSFNLWLESEKNSFIQAKTVSEAPQPAASSNSPDAAFTNSAPSINNADMTNYTGKKSTTGISLNEYDLVLDIASIKMMGLISIICAILNPIVTLICGILGKQRGQNLTYIPPELTKSYKQAIEYNEKGIGVSSILLVIEAIAVLIGIIVLIAQLV